MTTLFFDIETIPAHENQIPLLKRLHEEKLAKEKEYGGTNTPEDFEQFYRRTALNGAFGQLFCISMIKQNGSDVVLNTTLQANESAMLTTFWEQVRDVHLFVGHGIRFFDLKFLMQRSIVHKIPYRTVNLAKFRDNPVFDTMDQWMMYDGTISLHELSLALGIPSPKEHGIDGAQVYDFYLAQKYKDICDYCMRDVETVKAIYERLAKYKI